MKQSIGIVVMLLVFGGVVTAVEKDKSKGGSLQKTTTGVTWAKHELQGFSMKVWISNQIAMGIEALDPLGVPIGDCNVGIGLEYPAGSSSCIEHLFGFGPMIGGLVNGARRVSQSYEEGNALHEFVPLQKDTARDKIWRTSTSDIMIDNNFNPPRDLSPKSVNVRNFDDDHDGKIDEDVLDGLDNDGDWNPLTDDIGADGVPDSMESGCNGGYDPVTNPDPAFDNYSRSQQDLCHADPATGAIRKKDDKNLYTEKNGLPDHGEPNVDEDYAAISDQDFYLSATDTATGPAAAVGSGTTHVPMYLKIFQKSYAFQGDFADGILFVEYEIINLGKYTIKDVYVGLNADMDVGPVNIPNYFQDNYSCYMTDLRTAYIHNAKDRGSTPLGLTVLNTPLPLNQLQYVFQWYPGGAVGAVDSSVYGWLKGEPFGGQLIKQCSSPLAPADMRVFFSFGPFNGKNPAVGFAAGETLKIAVALVSGEGVDNGVRSLRSNAEKAIRLYKNGLYPAAIPPSPKLTITEGFKKVTLTWKPHESHKGGPGPYDVWDDSNKIAESFPDTSFRRINPPCTLLPHVCTNGQLPGGRIIEGFRLYRSEDPGSQAPPARGWTLVRQFDLADDAYEFNTGIESTFVDTNLIRGRRYWYAVTSFGIPNIAINEIPTDSGTITFDTLYTPGGESPISVNAKYVDLSFSTSNNLNEVLVVPNPYRVDNDYTFESGGWEGRASAWTENKRLVKFIHLPTKCTIRVFSLSGDLVATLDHDDQVRGELEWNLLSESNRALSSGVYIFTVESDLGKQTGKFVLIR